MHFSHKGQMDWPIAQLCERMGKDAASQVSSTVSRQRNILTSGNLAGNKDSDRLEGGMRA
jgi:hypothetical protein